MKNNVPSLKNFDVIKIKWSDNGEEFSAVVFGDKIGYTDGKMDSLRYITDCAFIGLCTIKKIH